MTKNRRRWVFAGVALALAVGVYVGFGPWASIERTNLTRDDFTACYNGLVLPPTATDISVYVKQGWSDENIVVSFTVPDEQTYVDWVTPLIAAPGHIDQSAVLTFDGGQLQVKRLHGCLAVVRGDRETEYLTFAIYDPATRRVYYQKAHLSTFGG